MLLIDIKENNRDRPPIRNASIASITLDVLSDCVLVSILNSKDESREVIIHSKNAMKEIKSHESRARMIFLSFISALLYRRR